LEGDLPGRSGPDEQLAPIDDQLRQKQGAYVKDPQQALRSVVVQPGKNWQRKQNSAHDRDKGLWRAERLQVWPEKCTGKARNGDLPQLPAGLGARERITQAWLPLRLGK